MYFCKSITTLTQAVIFGALLSIGAVSPSVAEKLSFNVTAGGITDDFIGRSEQYSTLGFNGVSLTGAFEYKRLSASFTAGQTIHGNNHTLRNYDLFINFLVIFKLKLFGLSS